MRISDWSSYVCSADLETLEQSEPDPMAIIPFDDRDGLIWQDGRMVAWREAKVHVLTHGLHYASCVFEGARVYNGQAFKLHEQPQRPVRSAELMGFKLPYQADRKGGVEGKRVSVRVDVGGARLNKKKTKIKN